MKHLLPLACTALLLFACAPAPIIPPEEVEPPRFTQLAPIGFQANELRIASDFAPSFRAPHVEHLFQTTPAEAMAIWAKDRLKISGQGGLLELEIIDASVTEIPLQVKTGLGGLLTTEPSERYDARLVATLKLYDGIQRLPAAETEVTVQLSRSIEEGADVYAREQFFNDFLEDMMAAFNTQMETEITAYFQPFLITIGN